MANSFRVIWNQEAIKKLGRLYNTNPQRVFRKSKHLLSANPYRCAEGIADFPDYKFNSYLWININNVILIYNIDSDYKLVSIEACYSALTGEVAEIFYGVSPDDE